MDYGFARGRRGSPTVHPCTHGELARILRAILRTDSSSARRVRGAPASAPPARGHVEACRLVLLRTRPWMAGSGAIRAPLAVPQPRRRSREQGAHVRLQGCRT